MMVVTAIICLCSLVNVDNRRVVFAASDAVQFASCRYAPNAT